MRAHHLACAAAALAVAVGTAGMARGPVVTGHADSTASIGFETPTLVDPVHTSGEPDVRIDPLGRVFASSPTGTGTQRSIWLASPDGGHTFRLVSQGLATTAQPGSPSSLSSLPGPQPGGGDTEIDFDHTGKQYFSDLEALTCLRVATSTDGGATTSESPHGCDRVPGADRQWFTVFDPPAGTPTDTDYTGPRPLIYLEYNHYVTSMGPGAGAWLRSNDGITYTNASVDDVFGADGYPSIDQVTGKVFQANYSGSAVKLNIGTPDQFGNLAFRDDANGPGLITVANHVANDGGDVANFVVSSMDSARNLYVAWVGRSSTPAKRQTYVAVASAASGWSQWTTAQVSQPPSMAGVFPWVKAGGPGRADVVWYGETQTAATPTAIDPSTDGNQTWDVYMSQAVFPVDAGGGVTGAAPAITQVKVTPHPMHYNSICLQGTGCVASKGNRNLADFFEVNADHSGAAEIVYNDTSNGLCQPGFAPAGEQIADHCGAPVITIARQSSGPGLLGSDVSGPSSAPTASLSHPAGLARYPVINGQNVPGLDVLDTSLALGASTLTITSHVVDLSNPSATVQALNSAGDAGTTNLQYVTRWQMGNSLYYAMMEVGAAAPSPNFAPAYYAGPVQSVELCSVSACYPHVLTYPEASPGVGESGTVSCPAKPSAATPCTLTITVAKGDVGNPTDASLLEEVGTYAFTSSHLQSATTNAQAQEDNVPLLVEGLCCFNFQAGPGSSVPEAPWAPTLVVLGLAGLGAAEMGRRRRRAA